MVPCGSALLRSTPQCITQAQWYAVMGSNPSRFDGCGPDCPVEDVSWYDVQEFIGKLNERGSGEVPVAHSASVGNR